jgi:hypothetical protein
MITKIFRDAGSNGPLGAGDHYKLALDAIAQNHEAETAFHLKAMRRILLEGRHWTRLSDADLRRVQPDLTVAKFHALFGDEQTEQATSSWLTEEASAMARRHRNLLSPNPLRNVA